MTTEQRLAALGTSLEYAPSQTFLGNFGQNYEKYNKWGYDFYEMNDRYENYSFRGMETYNVIEQRRLRWSYNEFGDRITKMNHTGRVWGETYLGDGTFYVDPPENYINSMATYNIDGVWLAREATEDWNVSVVGAGAIRKKFTPLTMSLPNINGMSIEFESPKTKVSFINSSLLGDNSVYLGRKAEQSDLSKYGGLLLRGGSMRRKFGVLTLGATYVNQYSVQGNREGGDDWFGTVNNFTPTPIIVAMRFLDDSPNDGEGGAVIYQVRLKVNGRYREDIIPKIFKDSVKLDRTTSITSLLYNKYLTPLSEAIQYGPPIDHLNTRENIPKYGDYLYYLDYIRGNNIKKVNNDFNLQNAQNSFEILDNSKYPIHANGNDSVVYFFDLASIKEVVQSVEAEVTVANDYRIQTSEIFSQEIAGTHDTSGDIVKWYRALYWKTLAQADGNIKDGSNVRTINLKFGFQVASVMYGFDADFNYYGVKVSGEFVTNSSHYMFPDGLPGTGDPQYIVPGQAPREGDRWTLRDTAYYVTAKKDWNKIGFGAEVFKMGKFYRPYMDYYTSTVQDRYMWDAGQCAPRNHILRIPLIEDNDDDDQYPDTDWSRRTMGYSVWAFEDADGVFPGNDKDHDGLPDNNKNNNSIPDYSEPFLMFDSDPDEFVFGDDFNNNQIPDYREDDMKFDTPYDLDRKGYHAFMRYSLFPSLNATAGRMRTRGVGLDNRTFNDYIKLNLDYKVFSVGIISAEYRFERIQDDISDPYLRVELTQKQWYSSGTSSSFERFQRSMYYDMLDYKNSKVHKLYIDSKIRAIPSITLENLVKYEVNGQIKGELYDGTYQQKDTITNLSMVNKVVYTKQFGDFVFSPGIKFRFYKRDRSLSTYPYDHYLMRIPLVTLKYIISPVTDIMVGFEGFKYFELRVRDYVQPDNDFKRQSFIVQLQNKTSYFGYNVWASTGFKADQVDYDSTTRQFEESKTSTVFVNVLVGW
ncbi:hypothetical protein LLG96_14950 [bacterium]|nr:hypothetical protein [bacterium]